MNITFSVLKRERNITLKYFTFVRKICKQMHCVGSYLKRSKLCIGMIQIFKIPEGDDFRLLQAINFL